MFDLCAEAHSDVFRIYLRGELDASTAPQFRRAIDEAVPYQPKNLELAVHGLDYLSSAGLRVLVYAQQKLGPATHIYVIGAREAVREVFMLTGFHNSVILADDYPEY
jgi:anti-anti-sigma factor